VTKTSTFARAAAAAAVFAIVAPARAQMAGAARPDLPVKMAPLPTTPAVTTQDLMSRLYVFADDSMQGREAGTPGHVRGTEYIVRELTRLGVKPMGEKGSYYQVVPVADARFDLSTSRVTVDGAKLTPGVDFHPFPGIQDLPFALGASTKAPVVFGGRFGSLSAIRPEDARGKIVVFAAPTAQGGQPTWAVFAQDEAIAAYREAAALVVASFEITDPRIWKILGDESMMLKKEDRRVPMLIVTKNAASRLVGANIDTALVGLKGREVEIEYGPTYTDPPAPARNVIAMVEGSDPKLKGQMVVISAHSDHIGFAEETAEHDSLRLLDLITRPMGAESPDDRPLLPNEQAKLKAQLDSVRKLRAPRPDSISNGADDDGTGSMGLLELAEYFQTLPQKPKRSILFVWNVAEEKGLFGSEWFTEHPTVSRDSLIADINIDMIGRGGASDIENGGMDYLQILGSRRVSTEYGNWVEDVNKKPDFGFKFDYQFDAPGHPQQYYCRSDHWNFAKWSIPTVFFSTGSHVDYHMVTDEPQYIDYPHYAKVVNFVGAFAADVANRPLKPVVDKPRGDPHGDCKQ
jgi:hypothetical protein